VVILIKVFAGGLGQNEAEPPTVAPPFVCEVFWRKVFFAAPTALTGKLERAGRPILSLTIPETARNSSV